MISSEVETFDIFEIENNEDENRWKCDTKAPIRTAMTKNHNSDVAAKNAIFLPAEECLCVFEAERQGTIDKDTVLWTFDKSKETLAKSTAILEARGYKVMPAYGDALENINSFVRAGILKPDFCFLDLCGQYTPKVKETVKLLTKHCPVSLTIMSWDRHPELFGEFIASTAKKKDKAAKVLNNLRRKKRYGFVAEAPPSRTEEVSTLILASLWTQIGNEINFATNYRGLKKWMFAISFR